MKLSRSLLSILVLALLFSASALFVSADGSSPKIKAVSVINNGTSLIVEIRGQKFGKDSKAIQLVMNDKGPFGEVLSVKPQKIVAQLPLSVLCSGGASLRVLVNRIPTNPVTVDLSTGTPSVDSLEPKSAQPGAVVEIRGKNFGCQSAQNLVSFNHTQAEVLATGANSLSVRVPEIAVGPVQIKVGVGGQMSAPIQFIVAPKGSPTSGEGSGQMIQFAQTSGIPGEAGFAPMFSINDTTLYQGLESSLWDAAFSGKHQAIIQAPWKTTAGTQQVALLTLICMRSNSLAGNLSREFEKFIYVRVNFPIEPHKPYDPENNPFWWGASGLATEHFPQGGIYYNSVSRALGGVDAFQMLRAVPGKAKFNLTMKVISPDLFKYGKYGENYDKAGEGIVFMPKVATITLELDQIDMRYPIALVNTGRITINDESGKNGFITTEKATFKSSIFDPRDLDAIPEETQP